MSLVLQAINPEGVASPGQGKGEWPDECKLFAMQMTSQTLGGDGVREANAALQG